VKVICALGLGDRRHIAEHDLRRTGAARRRVDDLARRQGCPCRRWSRPCGPAVRRICMRSGPSTHLARALLQSLAKTLSGARGWHCCILRRKRCFAVLEISVYKACPLQGGPRYG
jgi:hypothetical protein